MAEASVALAAGALRDPFDYLQEHPSGLGTLVKAPLRVFFFQTPAASAATALALARHRPAL